MLALSPQFCSLGWLLEDPISHEQDQNINYLSNRDQITETSGSIDLHSPNSSRTQPKNDEFASFNGEFGHRGDENKIVKKLNHNASERDRRKRINTLYSTLRSLLPPDDHSRKLSIPATVSRVVKYIPELQKELERLSQKKENLIMKISSSSSSTVEEDSSFVLKNQRIKPTHQSSLFSAAAASKISDREIVIQSSVATAEKRALSEALMGLEQEGFLVMNATSFESFDGRVFYNLHLRAQGSHQLVDVEMLKEKLWPF